MQVKSVNVIDKYFVFLDIFMSASEELKTGDSLCLQFNPIKYQSTPPLIPANCGCVSGYYTQSYNGKIIYVTNEIYVNMPPETILRARLAQW